MKYQIVWFRTDLRIHDNRALQAALDNAQSDGPVVALYIASPAQWDEHDDALIKRDFWRRSLLELEQALFSLNIPLVCLQVQRWNDVAAAIRSLSEQVPLSALHFNREYPINEQQRDEQVITVCADSGIAAHAHHDRLLTVPANVLNGSGEPYKVFTPYSRQVRKQLASSLPSRPEAQKTKPGIDLKNQFTPGELDWGSVTAEKMAQWQQHWPAGEVEAGAVLHAFCENALHKYDLQRDIPAIKGTSRLSSHLAAGTLSVRQCWNAAAMTETMPGNSKAVETWQNELIWRDYYQYVMYHYPHVCKGDNWRNGIKVIWRQDAEAFRAWCDGRTGIPIVDAAMRQLLKTGWMHNRLRMVTAMFLSKNLLLDWRLGERWFMQHLIDGDFASNNGGWQWSASTGTDAAPYFRVFNPVSQSQRFDPEGTFIRYYVPELADLDARDIHEPGAARPENYPPPLVDLKTTRKRAIDAFR